MDFTKLENIIFAATAGALALFLIIMAFYVISKGRRKTSGLDIFLRIVASLVLIVSAALFVLAIFTELTGSFRIDAAGDRAYFIIGDSATKLPLGVIFVALTTTTGQSIVVLLFGISFMTLVGDCLLAKKKFGKKTRNVKKTPEELKREAELAKIRKLSDAAVKKSNSAANAADKTSTDASDKVKDEKPEDQQKPDEPEEDFDWRVDAKPEKSNEFVGISETTDDFDSFDSFDEARAEDVSEARSDLDGIDETEKTTETEETEKVEESDESEQAKAVADEKPWYEQDDPADERIIAEALADNSRPSYKAGGYGETVETTETTTVYEMTETTETVTEQFELDDVVTEAHDENDYAETELNTETENSYNDYYSENTYGVDSHDIEPDRNIYIPGIRTVNRAAREEKKHENTKPARRSASKPATSTAKKPVSKKPTAKKPVVAAKVAEKPAAKKPIAKKPAARKPAAKSVKSETADPKKLPVTKRYVILDRTNAVNIFSNYLKEREKAEKDKLESSINTVIIK